MTGIPGPKLKLANKPSCACIVVSSSVVSWIRNLGHNNSTDYTLHYILQLDTGHKTMKSSTFRNSAFWRCAGTCQNNQCTTAPSAKPGQLFGVSLMDVYDNDNLPFPILDMLSFINQKGPLTKGIFRKSGSRKSCRILKEKLNSGDRVNLDSESVLVVASVLKACLVHFLIENCL
ncbi:rho GTPase-activating protein 20-like isoform X2 [Canis lupus baileyi]|uniref:rho GTPase-activating protein 20-like isoform X2 n=1 Tax=Canis lupus baileyi TaxID=143281 RepID=UPI003B973195